MKVATVAVSQSSLRNINQIHDMVDFVNSGGFWTQDELIKYSKVSGNPCCGLIQIHKLDDSFSVLHDGHHRMVATFLSKRDYLREDEYEIKSWPYLDPEKKTGYLDINHENGWYTPFDPRTHLRVADIKEFKQLARIMFESNPERAIQWIEENSSKFRTPISDIRTVADLSRSLFPNFQVSCG